MHHDQQVIDTIMHGYTGSQMLESMMTFWREHGNEKGVIVLAPRGLCMHRVNAIRIALSKSRKRLNVGAYFGFTASEPFPWTHVSGYRADAVTLRYRETLRQKVTFLLDKKFLAGAN